MTDRETSPTTLQRCRRMYWIALVLLSVANVAKVFLFEGDDNELIVTAFLFVIGAVLGWVTFAVAGSRIKRPLKNVLVLVIAYHAFFGPIMLGYNLLVDASRNDDLAIRMYPHVIAFIDSFE